MAMSIENMMICMSGIRRAHPHENCGIVRYPIIVEGIERMRKHVV